MTSTGRLPMVDFSILVSDVLIPLAVAAWCVFAVLVAVSREREP